MKKHSQSMVWSLAWIWLVTLLCGMVQAAAPDWHVVNYPNYTGVLARVKKNGVPIRSAGSLLAAFYGDELRGVAEILGANPDDDIDGEYYFSLLFGSNQAGEKGFTFKVWDSEDDQIYDVVDVTLDFDTNYPTKPEVYGGFTTAGFVPCIMNIGPSPCVLILSGGKINGTTATTGRFNPGDIVTITANTPSTSQALKIWTPNSDVEFIGSVLGATTTIVMPDHDVIITASFIAKTSMPAVSVRSTTNTGDDTAKEPTNGVTDKGKFTFTRTSVNQSQALTVYFSIRGTAENGVDYKSIPGSVTFAANATSATVEIEPLTDSNPDEGDETVEIVLEAAPGTQTYRGGTYTDATITIEDGPAPDFGTVKYTLVSNTGTAVAGAQWKIDDGDWNNSGAVVTTAVGTHTIYFKEVSGYTTPASQTVEVVKNVMTQGTATYVPEEVKYTLTLSGGKINGTSATSARFSAGEIVTITANPPSTSQALKIWTPSQNVEFIGSVLGATTTIVMPDHDVTITASFIAKTSMPAVSVRSTTNTGDDTAKEPTNGVTDKGKFTFTRTSVNQSQALTVYYSIRGTAENGVDYKSIPSTVTFAANATSATVEIEPLTDSLFEGDETVEVVLEAAPGTQTYRGGTYTDATITIEDGPIPVIGRVKYTLLSDTGTAVEGAQWKIDEGGDWNNSGVVRETTVGTHTIYFKEVSGYTTPASEDITVVQNATTEGTATYHHSDDYLLRLSGGKINNTSATSARFRAGDIVTITANPPNTNQALKIWTPDQAVEFIGSVLGATTTIVMPDHDVTITASFIAKSSMPAVAVRSTTNAGDDIAEEPTSATATADKGKFTFTRTSVNQSRALTVYYAIRGTATNGVDYKTIQSSVTFAANATSVAVEIEPLFDSLNEGDETVTVVLAAEPGTQTYRGGSVTDATITIEDVPVPGTGWVKYTLLSDTGTAVEGAQWKINSGAWNNSDAVVETTAGSYTIYFKEVSGYSTPASQTVTVVEGNMTQGTAIYIRGPVPAYHPADCIDQDYIISGLEYLQYVGPVKAAALGNYEYDWDGADVLSMVRKATRGGEAPMTRGGNIAVTRTVSPAVYTAGSTVEVTLTISGTDKMTNLFIGEIIPEGWTVLGNAANSVVDGVLRATWDAPNIPGTYTYTIQAPASNLAASYVIASSVDDTGCFADDAMLGITVENTELLNNINYHPADCISRDGKISGLEYLKYAGPVKAAALGNYEYTWDSPDVLTLRRKNATRGGATADDVMLTRSVDTTTYAANSLVTVTLAVTGADSMVSLFVGEKIPEGWSVVGDYAANVKNGVLRMTWDAPNIPDTITYTLQAPADKLAANYQITGSSVDTGCFVDRVVFLTAGNTVLTLGQMSAEWPEDMALYAPVDGRNFRESDNLAVTFSWPAILNAESYRLVVTTYDGATVFDETLEETTCTVYGLECGAFIWNVTANGEACIAGTIWQDFRFAVIPNNQAPIIIGAVADGTTVKLAFDTADASYTDGVVTYQVVFYSLANQALTNFSQTTTVANGQAVIDLGVDASNGYLYIRPVTTPESDFTELYIK